MPFAPNTLFIYFSIYQIKVRIKTPMIIETRKYRSLRSHHSQETHAKPASPQKKLTVVTQTVQPKKSSPVSFKNAFRNILLCQFGKGDN